MKSGFIWQSLITSSVINLRGSSKALVKVKLAPEKSHSHCLEVCCPSDPIQLSESWLNHYIGEVCSTDHEMHQKLQCLQLALVNTVGWTVLHNNAQLLVECCTTNTSKVEQIELWSFASSATFPSPPPIDCHFKYLDNFCMKMLPQPAGGKKCLPRVCSIPKHAFLCYRNKQAYFSFEKMCGINMFLSLVIMI